MKKSKIGGQLSSRRQKGLVICEKIVSKNEVTWSTSMRTLPTLLAPLIRGFFFIIIIEIPSCTIIF